MDFLKSVSGSGSNNHQQQQQPLADERKHSSGGGGFMGMINDSLGSNAPKETKQTSSSSSGGGSGGFMGMLNNSTGSNAPQEKKSSSGGGGIMGMINNSLGGGPAAEKKEDSLDKAIDYVQEHVFKAGPQHNESALEQAKDAQIASAIRSQYKGFTGKDFPVGGSKK